MTQVDPTAPPQQPYREPAAQPPQQITEADLWQRICAQAGAILGRPKDKPIVFGRDFPIGHMFVFWKGEPQADGSVPARGVTIYERGKPAPIKASQGIMALFGFADDFVRVYTIPIDPAGKDLGPARITLSRTAPVPSLFFEYMSVDQLVLEIATEVANELGGPPDDDDDDDDEEDDEEEDEDDDNGSGFTPA